MVRIRPVVEKQSYKTSDCAYADWEDLCCWGAVIPRIDIVSKNEPKVLVACEGHAPLLEAGRYLRQVD